MAEKRVLLVEDDRDIGNTLCLTLLGAGYSADWVATAADACRRIEVVPHDLVISDWRLGDGGDGMEVVGLAADRGMKTMLISSYLFSLTDPDPRHDYLMKPMRPGEITAAAERLIGPA